MKILALVTDAFGGAGGIAQYNRDFLSAAAEIAFVTALPRRPPQRHSPIPARIDQRGARPGRFRYSLCAVADALTIRPHVIFCGHLYMAALAAIAARLTGAQLVIQLHGIDAWEPPNWLNRRAVDAADLILCVSRDTRRRVLAWSDIAAERVVVVPNTVDDRFVPGDRMAARMRFGLGPGPVLLSVSRLDARERYKGQDRVIAALPGILKSHPGALYLIAGDGDDRPRLECLSRSIGVLEHVRFLGAVPAEALPELYRAADLFVLPSTGEGFGIVFIEAMACGTQALGLPDAGASDALLDGDLGHISTPETLAEDISAVLARTRLSPPELARRVQAVFGRNAFQTRVKAILARSMTHASERLSGSAAAHADASSAPTADAKSYVLVLEPGRAQKDYWRDLWRYRELFAILAWRDIAVRYKQTVIGVAWAVVRPFLTMIVFTVVFGRIAKLPTDGTAPYPILVFAGLLPWFLFSTILGDASNGLVGNSQLIGKVYFPRLIIPCAAAMVALVDFAINFIMLMALMLWFGALPGWQIVLLPAFIAMAVLASLGPALLLTALNVKYRDFRYIIPFILQFGLYVSPVGFSSAVVPEQWRLLYSLNPVVGVIDGFRWCLLGGESQLYMPGFLLSLGVVALFLWIGVRYFRQTERTFADLL